MPNESREGSKAVWDSTTGPDYKQTMIQYELVSTLSF